MIPKNLIQLYLGAEDRGFEYLSHLNRGWQIAYPDWNHVFIKNLEIEEIVKAYSEEAWELYNKIPVLSYRADFARLIVLYTYGGLYVDLDTRPNLDLEQYVVFNEKMLWGMCFSLDNMSGSQPNDQYRGVTTMNHLVACEKESPFIKKMIENMIKQAVVELGKDSNKNREWKNGFWAAKIVSTAAWGSMLLNELDELCCESDFLAHHRKSGYGNFGVFWITWDGKDIHTRKYRNFVTHIGSIVLKDFNDTNPSVDPIASLSNLYKDISLQNGEIKIYSRGNYGF